MSDDSADVVARLEKLFETWRAEMAEALRRLEDETVRTRVQGEALTVAAGIEEQLVEVMRERDHALAELSAARSELERMRAQPEREPSEAAPADREVKAPPPLEALSLAPIDAEGNRLRMGEILYSAGVITLEQLDTALRTQVGAPGRKLGDILVQRGFTGEDVIAQVLASQLNTPFVRLIDEPIQEDAPSLISGRLARLHHCIPLRSTTEEVVLAMENPLDLIAVDDVELAANRRVRVVVATHSDIRNALEKYYEPEPTPWY